MVLLPFKVLFLVAVFGIWNRTGNAILISGIWALASFLISVFASGLSIVTGNSGGIQGTPYLIIT